MPPSDVPGTVGSDTQSLLHFSDTFPAADRDKAEFWAWLGERYVVRVKGGESREDRDKEGRLRIVSREDLRQLITEALEANNQGWADELLQLASNSQQPNKEILRKSIRVQSGEYLKLLYVKLIENSSFPDVILRLLQRPAKSYVSTLRSSLSRAPQSLTLRLDHLISQIDTWDQAKPQSRTRSTDLTSTLLDETGYLPAQYSLKLDDIKPIVSAYVLGEVERKIFQTHLSNAKEIYEEEFQTKWRTSIEESIPDGIALKPVADQKDRNTVVFAPVLNHYDSLDEHQTQKLFEKYSEDAVLAFASSFHDGKDTEAYNEYILKLRKNEVPRLTIPWEVELPSCSATVMGPTSINAETVQDPAMDRRISEDEMLLWSAIEKVSKKVGLNPNVFFRQEREARGQGRVAESSQLTDFIKLATKTATTPGDFSDIRMMTTVRNRILSYRKVKSFIEELVSQTLTRRSVVSFYVNGDVWRLLPLVIESKSWIPLADEFLKSKQSQRATSVSTVP
jgi:hypothetical protein